ncbi:MAG: Actin-like ATPase involved in cell division-like protein [Candidatus Berkelbacteria bacterium Gr01-1014_85]|uniref:Actin-like ATPase involved in cell division-like protein n=1 Tax=Candidatus Berkelbacteria bacterium Gr01-1014_85 TaxID=2017150 RepID=A0A554J9V3_9BACT|nr:MAG: Actin-like ATPase involved in cell division-like protein [Candidatus Berkelbacteria bacterium Gr01-1014_85]
MGFFDRFKAAAPASDLAIALDIGTEFVKALIFKVDNDGKAYVLGVGRQRQKLSDMQGGTVTDIHGVIKNCEAAIERAAETAGVVPHQVIIGIAGELVKGTTTEIIYHRPKPENKIDYVELKDIISRVQRRAFDRARTLLAWESGQSELDVRLVNAAIVDTRIDGYRVTNPLGFQGREVKVGIYNCFAPIVHLGALQTIADELELDLLSVAAEPYAVARCLGPDDSAEFSAIFIDIGGGTSDIAVVRSGGLEGTKMFALGGRAFTKRISQTLNLNFAAAEELKLAYSTGAADPALQPRIQEAMQTDAATWLAGVELTLEEFGAKERLPSKILLCGGGSALPEITQALAQAEWAERLPFATPPIVHFLKPMDLGQVIDNTGELTEPRDVTPMALANLAIELIGAEPVLEGVLRRVVTSLKS